MATRTVQFAGAPLNVTPRMAPKSTVHTCQGPRPKTERYRSMPASKSFTTNATWLILDSWPDLAIDVIDPIPFTAQGWVIIYLTNLSTLC